MLAAVGGHMRLVQRCRMQHGGDAVHAVTNKVAVGDRARPMRERTFSDIGSDYIAPRGRKGADQRFPEMTGTAGHQNRHDGQASPSRPATLAHDPEKCEAVFRKDHAQTTIQSAMAIQPNPIALWCRLAWAAMRSAGVAVMPSAGGLRRRDRQQAGNAA